MKITVREFNMKLKSPFSISRHTYLSQPNIVIELQHDGHKGYGEATINPYYNITIANLKDCFQSMQKRLSGYNFETPNKLYDDFYDYLHINTFALAALNNASWDLFGKLLGSPVSDVIDLPKRKAPLTSYTLGISDENGILQKMIDLPWPIYKIKLGTDNDLDIIKFIRRKTKSLIRVDANCAWDFAKTIRLSEELKNLNVEFIEQPLASGDPEQGQCFTNSALPLIADESCCIESDVKKCAGKFHGINIKLLKCGGLTPALRMIKIAKVEGLKIMVGCMTESSVGISAAAQLLPYIDFADLDGPLLLDGDLANGLVFDYGKITISQHNGLGIVFNGNEQ